MKTPLYDLAHAGDADGVRSWLAQHPDDLNADIGDGYTLLHVACLFGHESLARMLVERGALVNSNARNDSRATPLHAAVAYREESTAARLVDLLVANGAELNSPQHGGQTALHHAVGRGSVPLTKLLVGLGADPHLKDELGRAPAGIAQTFAGGDGDALKAELRRAHTLET